ncbi:zinc metallopeptidase [Deinococcus sp. KNUC1210]|uniref:KPN_02809 family neutral zinc metallopeptidase n=1 Tax=Deinococcus sp. KNUC1210 TaxID=2917691 RepID=UPI001EF0DA8F|nr:neutral zinc metallopeptidase [Deinococcus sp. KNUC1210]ULH14678.1 zinc metallopeptidase [Deinococcus sp. KNUC1210]
MDWQNLPQSNNVEDQRGSGGGGRGGLPGGGVAIGGAGALILALIGWFFGIDTSSITGGGQTQTQTQTQTQQSQSATPTGGQPDQTREFVSRILGSTEQVWGNVFQKNGRSYQQPHLVLYSGQINSACGQASSAVGPFYCPSDEKVYLDTDFFNEMEQRLGGGGDFADAYVIAHEIGHHVQNLLGISDQVDRAQRSARTEAAANKYSVGLELQADCFAGVWGKLSNGQTHLTKTDVQQAINTATAIGDDALQKQGQGYVVPDSFTHGSSQQRVNWFMTGFNSGDPAKCNTFSGTNINESNLP